MKISFFTVLAILVLINSCSSPADRNSKKFVLDGEISGQDSGMIVLSYFSDTTYICDTTAIINSKFTFTGTIFEPTQAFLFQKDLDLNVLVYIEPQRMKISIFKDKSIEVKMTGSRTQAEYELLNKMRNPVIERRSILRSKGVLINDSLKKTKDAYKRLSLANKAKEIDSLLLLALDEFDPIELKFVLENPKSFVTPYCLLRLESKEVISVDSVKSIFNELDNSLKKSRYSKIILENIRKKENIRIGSQAPEFKATDLNQQTLTLSQFRGKGVVLLEFWASWCVPCRENIPHLKTIFKRYHTKGLEIIAISIDENREAWIEAVNQDTTAMWYHIPVAEKWPAGPYTINDIYQNYYYHGVPYQILIDKNGAIIDRFEGYTKENETSLDKLLFQIFKN